ncbi:hypothetical protein PHLGIDRAFT_102139 [Phlebiopsis gigantea 11061_1 CR5-6]|uniref:Zn(2)-C6 fungal-type domain-containing protein n=1 Tax=Phlebiopsis gigantea (strain 11061_1 CR5-6) TaxID=745531 RepID=A0A0C3NWQ9_PHLG1|nr:hypothetical protein PHLGIDRAFT_102139 [Phlebiopsis gigantea 11061_1 CR5-6]
MPTSQANGGDPATLLAHVRVKHPRPLSPPPPAAHDHHSTDTRPSAPKRARKAINCEPCRNSKLKCDRNRPCSSCVLRGTTASCYQTQDESGRDDQQQSRIDPAAELTRIRHSLNLLESHLFHNGGATALHSLPATIVKQPPSELDRVPSPDHSKPNVPGMVGQSDFGGYFAGATSTLSHIHILARPDSSEVKEENLSSSLRSSIQESVAPYQTYDDDLIQELPPLHAIDGFVDYYFEYCNWIYRHVNKPAFMRSWARFKAGNGGNRVVLATVCILILLARRYLPTGHVLHSTLPCSSEELEPRYYGIMRMALQRHGHDLRRDGLGKGYTLDLVELLLVRSHYLTFAKEDPEETWSVKGELMNIGTAMGLHKDPGDSRFSHDEAERRRWAWWHIILLERWQAFMFGRPISIASNHFNTRLPSYCDSTLTGSERLYLPNVALFKLAFILGDIMDDAVSFQPVKYESIQESDRKLTKWLDDLPPELDLDDYAVTKSLGSAVISVRRLGVQSVIIRTAYHHIRFTLHRPYAYLRSSLDTAVNAASKLIHLVGQTRSEFLSNSALAVPGHMNWGPFHVFSAAMFFSFQLISHGDQRAAGIFRENIKKAITCLEQSRWMPVADKALTILQALAPLYSDDFATEPPHEQKRKKAKVLKLVKTLAFPYQDNPSGRGDMSSAGSSPSVGGFPPGAGVAASSSHIESPNSSQLYGPLHKHTHTQLPVSSVRWTPSPTIATHMQQQQQQQQQGYMEPGPQHMHAMPSTSNGTSHHQHQHQHQQLSPVVAYPPAMPYGMPPPPLPPPSSNAQDLAFYTQTPADETSMWGASVGFGVGEWAQFLDVMQRPDDSERSRHHHHHLMNK